MDENEFQRIDNMLLLENNLVHLKYELKQSNIFYFRVAKEAHLALYRSMVEALKGSANLAVTGKAKDKSQTVKYQRGNAPWMEIHKSEVVGCKKAWRFSEPEPCDEPDMKAQDFLFRPPKKIF